MTNRFPPTATRRLIAFVALVAACEAGPGPIQDAARVDVHEMPDAQAATHSFPTKPLCAREVAYPAVSGEEICAVQIPSPDAASFDSAKVNLVLRVGGARVLIFDYVAESASCAALLAWHYDDAAHPSQLVLCPEACSLAGSDPDSQVQLLVGCDTQ